MAFTHDVAVSLRSAAALVNTAPPPVGSAHRDRLTSIAHLDRFLDEWQMTGHRSHDAAELAAMRALRRRLRQLWALNEQGAVKAVNAILAEAQAVPQLVDHDGLGWHLHATAASAPVDVRFAVEIAMALIDVLRVGELRRLKVCADPQCDAVLVDLSKNRSRRYCDGGCGNRANVAAYRSRRAALR